MKDYPYPYPWKKLLGTSEEMRFLADRFEGMSAREQYLLEGASQFQSIETAADLINLTEQLDSFAFYFGATDDGKLGDYIAQYRENATYAQLPFLDLIRWGKDVREQHGGVFVSGGFVEQISPCQRVYDGENLDRLSKGEAAVRLKLTSRQRPDGVWIKLPDHEIHTNEPDEVFATKGELGITEWDQAVLLGAKCCLGNIADLIDQYDSLERLIGDGNNLGYVLEEQGQGMPCFEAHLRAAMELENCTRLDHALDISQNLACFDFIPEPQQWDRYGRHLARQRGVINPDSPAALYFDYAAYCKTEIERLGLQPCAQGYIARNDREFIYELSRPPRQEQGLSL